MRGNHGLFHPLVRKVSCCPLIFSIVLCLPLSLALCLSLKQWQTHRVLNPTPKLTRLTEPFSEKAKRPLSNNYRFSSDVSRFHSVSRKIVEYPAKKFIPAKNLQKKSPLWFEPSSSPNLLQQTESKSGWWVQTMKGSHEVFGQNDTSLTF